MDTLAPRFNGTYSGGFTDGRGEFFREAQSPDGSGQLMRISFDHITEVAFDWELAVSRDDGVTWHSLWTMAMTRVGP